MLSKIFEVNSDAKGYFELGQYIVTSVVERPSELNIHMFRFVTHQLHFLIQVLNVSIST